MSAHILNVDIQSYWHPGTGRGSGFHLDAITHEGADGLPRLPGRTLKGLLRDAMERAESWQWEGVPVGSANRLFGPRGRDGAKTEFGLLRVSDATLPSDVAAYLANHEDGSLIPGLYREHFSTAIGPNGVAVSRSLRGMRVVVPLTLQAAIATVPGVEAVADWRERLNAALVLVTAVGAHRNRGFGRAVLSWKEV